MTPPDRAALVRLMADAAWVSRWPNEPLNDGLRGTTAYRHYTTAAGAQLAALEAAGVVLMPTEATEEMHHAARDWSYAKYGKPIGLDASKGCWDAMVAASPFRSKP